MTHAGSRGPRVGRGADPRRRTGACGEQLAAEHLQRLGFSVLARNQRTGEGEIDIIVRRAGLLVFVEVKTRVARDSRPPEFPPLEALRRGQQLRLRRAASTWLKHAALERPRPSSLRFDAIAVVLDARGNLLRLDHVEDAW